MLPNRCAPALLLAFLAGACDRTSQAGGPEEVAKAEAEVPEAVRATARRVCQLLGPARTGRWAWDEESGDWEVELLGLARQAELDILTDGTFSELELAHTFAEIQAVLPEVAETIRQKCHAEDAFIELSLRSEAHLAPLLELEPAWARDAVVLEFQCKSGRDFELDARRMMLEAAHDDLEAPR
ncbi:MAG TPA: hypothetical protein VF530_20885 [Planctomycetota bacterium]